MARKIVFGKIFDKIDCELKVFKQISEYMEWVKSDPNKGIWSEGSTRLSKEPQEENCVWV